MTVNFEDLTITDKSLVIKVSEFLRTKMVSGYGK